MGQWFIIANMEDLQPNEMRRRIRELLSIPDRDRTDAEWDELNELEIRTAPGNRDYDRSQDNRQGEKRQGAMGLGRRDRPTNNKTNNRNTGPRQQQEGARAEGGGGNRMLKRQHRRPKRPQDNSSFNNAGNENDFSPVEISLSIPAANSEKSEE